MTDLPWPAPGANRKLGARLTASGVNFAIWAPRASRVELALIDKRSKQRNQDMTAGDDGVWTAKVAGAGAGQLYGYRVHGHWDPDLGQRFNPAKLLVDPYARAITGGVDYSGPIFDHTPESNFTLDPQDSLGAVPLSLVVADSPAPAPLSVPVPLDEMVIYELHVKGYTKLHPSVPEHLRGTYAGLAYPAIIDHLLDLGINAIELLPVHHFISEPFVVGRGLSNFWGYNTLGFFAPHAAYSASGSLGEQVTEFKQMVSAFHEAGIAVLLDVVYNHTAEGGHEGPTLCFRGIDHGAYYRLTHDNRNDYDVTGTGNALDSATPAVLRMIMDSLRYWSTDMGVDGFRFDLASTIIRDANQHVDQNHRFKQLIAADPALRDKVMIAEPWDIGPYGYQVGAWGVGWSEWNDRFRNFTRDLWRGAIHGVQEFAGRLTGSADIYDRGGRPATSSVNYITAHDGFTLRDLVTYDLKHNEANGERNHDGADDNRSWNHGYEGETTDPAIQAARQRTARNLMATLLLSTGVPMITAGDEMGRTQTGNNNAYCQDGPVSWVHWYRVDDWTRLTELTRTLLTLRATYPVLRSRVFRSSAEVRDSAGRGLSRQETAWFSERGLPMTDAEWNDRDRKFLAMYLSDDHDAFLMWFHMDSDPIRVRMPEPRWGRTFTLAATTGLDNELPHQALPGDDIRVPARTVAVWHADVPADARVAAAPST